MSTPGHKSAGAHATDARPAVPHAAAPGTGMGSNRLEAFSDGVFAIIITIMVLELKVPHGTDWAALAPLAPVMLSYVISFVYIGIYWNNHHHLFQAVEQVGGGVLWANLHLLFWLSLFPFVTEWMGENHFATEAVALYGVNLLMAGFAYSLLVRSLLKHHAPDSALRRAIGSDSKGKLSLAIYLAGIALSFYNARVAAALYVLVAVIWLVPDRRIEKVLVS